MSSCICCMWNWVSMKFLQNVSDVILVTSWQHWRQMITTPERCTPCFIKPNSTAYFAVDLLGCVLNSKFTKNRNNVDWTFGQIRATKMLSEIAPSSASYGCCQIKFSVGMRSQGSSVLQQRQLMVSCVMWQWRYQFGQLTSGVRFVVCLRRAVWMQLTSQYSFCNKSTDKLKCLVPNALWKKW